MGVSTRVSERTQGRGKKITDSFKEVKPTKEEVKRVKAVNRDIDENVNKRRGTEGQEVSIHRGDETEYMRAKRALHLSAPINLPCRGSQIEELFGFVKSNLLSGVGSSVYISGAPGTGKTAVVQHVLGRLSQPRGDDPDFEELETLKFLSVFINCMNSSPTTIYDEIYKQLHITSKTGDVCARIAKRAASKTGKPIVIVLDEMDQLLSRSKDILYRIFEWSRLPGSKLTLIGIANSLDLTVRHLPLLSSSPRPASPKPRTPRSKASAVSSSPALAGSPQLCKLMQFPPYERSDIEQILESRMIEAGNSVFEPTAIKFVAAKVAASTGDMRKALNACQVALDSSEKAARPVLKSTADDGFNPGSSPKKICIREEKVSVAAMSKALAPIKDDGVLPLQQRILLATLLKLNKEAPNSVPYPFDGVSSAIPMNSFYEVYRKVCSDKGFSWIDRSELVSICGLLEDRGLMQVHESSLSSSSFKKSLKGASKTNKSGLFFQPLAVEKLLRNDPVVTSIVG